MEKAILDAPILDLDVSKNFCDVEDSEKELITDIFLKEFEKNVDDIKKINSKYAYDSFRVDIGNESYVIKILYSEFSFILKNEYRNLNLVNEKYPNLLSPTALKFKEGDFCYLITSFEFADSVKNISQNCIFQNIDLFTSFIDAIHEVDSSKIENLQTKLDFNNSIIDLESEIEQKDILDLNNYFNLNFKKLKEILEKINKYISDNYKEENLVFCNFELRNSTILFRDIFKCINFENCYAADLHLSLKNISSQFGFNLSEQIENTFLRSYVKMSRIVSVDSFNFINEYRCKEKVNRCIIFLDIFTDQLFHLLTLGNKNSEKLYKNFDRYNHLRSDIKEILGDDIKKVDKIFNVAFTNKV
jgi:hypothetical protein